MAKAKIIQIVSNQNSIIGLGDDGKLYRFDTPTRQWAAMEE